MTTVYVWLLVGFQAGFIAKFPDQESCVAAHKSLETKPYSFRCVPAKIIIGKEQT